MGRNGDASPPPQVVPLASVIVKESLTEDDVLNCQKTIYNLVDMERKNDPLPISTAGTRGKGPKRYCHHHKPCRYSVSEQGVLLSNACGLVPLFCELLQLAVQLPQWGFSSFLENTSSVMKKCLYGSGLSL